MVELIDFVEGCQICNTFSSISIKRRYQITYIAPTVLRAACSGNAVIDVLHPMALL
jgi:hypothetical protein